MWFRKLHFEKNPFLQVILISTFIKLQEEKKKIDKMARY